VPTCVFSCSNVCVLKVQTCMFSTCVFSFSCSRVYSKCERESVVITKLYTNQGNLLSLDVISLSHTHTHTRCTSLAHNRKPHAFYALPFYDPRSHSLLHHRLRWNGNAVSRHQDQQPPPSRPSSSPASAPPSNGESRFVENRIVEAAVPLNGGALTLEEQEEQYPPAYQYEQGALPPPLETVSSSPHLQVVGAPLLPYTFAATSQNMPSPLRYPYPTTSATSTGYYSAAHGAQPFSYKDTVETAGQDSGRFGEDARRRGQLQAANSLVHLLNVSPGYVSPQ
jgi:hypothetical protein